MSLNESSEVQELEMSSENEISDDEEEAYKPETLDKEVNFSEEIETEGDEGSSDEGKKEEEEVEIITYEEYCDSTKSVLTPVGITLILTVIVVKILQERGSLYSQATTLFFPVDDAEGSSFGLPAWLIAIITAVVFVIMITIVTFVFVVLFYFRCTKVMIGWVTLSVILLLLLFGGSIFYQLLEAFNSPLDILTFAFVLVNFAVLGIVSVFFLSPMKLNQFYMIIISVFMATVFTNLPEWTTWMVLLAMACYDLVAVLCPKGPLRILVGLAQERNEPLPALIYSTAVWMGMTDMPERNEIVRGGTNRFMLSNSHGKGIKLGLGDFIFYSVLVGRCAMYDMTTVFTAMIAVISVC